MEEEDLKMHLFHHEKIIDPTLKDQGVTMRLFEKRISHLENFMETKSKIFGNLAVWITLILALFTLIAGSGYLPSKQGDEFKAIELALKDLNSKLSYNSSHSSSQP